ncbi:copper resistance D family protein [Paenibacillus sp. CAU 1782]
MYIYISETLLYLFFAFSGGYLLLSFVPDQAKPSLRKLPTLFQYALLGISVFSFVPIFRTTLMLQEYATNLTFVQVLIIVLKDYSFGNAWLSILFISTAMYALTMLFNPEKKTIRIALSVLWGMLIIAHGWASHPASFSPIWGLLAQSLHVAAMSAWLGTLLIVAWFAQGPWNWKAFVRWFTPLAIACILIIVTAGFVMMALIVEGYLNSWSLNYGEALLLKHLVFLPLLLLGFMNGFVAKITKDGLLAARLKWWLRAETIIAFVMLMITAFMGVQEPPHEGEFEAPAVSWLFQYLNGTSPGSDLSLSFSLPGLLLIAIGLYSIGLLYWSYKENKRMVFIIGLILVVLCPFLGLLLSLKPS